MAEEYVAYSQHWVIRYRLKIKESGSTKLSSQIFVSPRRACWYMQQLMQRVSRDDVKWKQTNIAWTWLVEMISRFENANEDKWFGFSFAINQKLSEQTRDVAVDKIHGKLREIGLKVKQGGYDLHVLEIRKVCEVQGGAHIALCDCAAKNHRNRFKPVMLFFLYTFFRHVQAKKTPYSVYSGRVLRFFFYIFDLAERKDISRNHNYFIWIPRWWKRKVWD